MYAIRITGLAMMILLSGCGNTTEIETTWCERDSLILISHGDQFTSGTARQIVLHNDHGRVVCGW